MNQLNQAEQTKIDELVGCRLKLSNYLVRRMIEAREAYESFRELTNRAPNDADLIRSREWHRAQISFIHGMAQEFGIEHESLKYDPDEIKKFIADAQG